MLSADVSSSASYTPSSMADVTGYWYWRMSATEINETTRLPCVEIAHTRLTNIVVRCSDPQSDHGKAAALANALNRAYGAVRAPRFDEQTGWIVA